MSKVLSLTKFIIQERAMFPQATEEFSTIMTQIALVGKIIARELSQAGLIDILGSTGATNIQGEEVQKLDERANEIFVQAFEDSHIVGTLISEEMETPVSVSTTNNSGTYALYFDPLDGSSNIDVNAPLGSIFSLHRLSSLPKSNESLLRAGSEQVAAGYILYGSSTILVYTCGNGVQIFTLDPGIGEFLLSAGNITIPRRGKIYSVNEGNRWKWTSGMQNYIAYLQETDAPSGRPYTGRYTGCLAADVHRILLKGGLYLYPGEVKKPEGKLRLLYECAPLTLVIEQAGGIGSTGMERISTIHPTALHQRVPLIIGSPEDVETAEQVLMC
ncbi:MAG: class 1 fructose-bisphosphatase [Nitrospirales bacterium]|nr:class 1 fructose-bisphosphatase [Nitrospirales bacterium]